MIAALDVHYDEPQLRGRAAAVVFERWEDANASAEVVTVVENIAPYVPGEFFRRELPCLVAVIEKIDLPIDAAVIDGYVQLGSSPGLGAHLFQTLQRRVPVIGVAKSRFRDAPAREVLRGKSLSPLFVTSLGIDSQTAADCISRMHGNHRIPTLLKRVDRIARG